MPVSLSHSFLCAAQICSALLSVLFLCIFGLSIAALVGRRQYWTYYTSNSQDPGAFNVESGWLDFRTRDTDSSWLWVSYGASSCAACKVALEMNHGRYAQM